MISRTVKRRIKIVAVGATLAATTMISNLTTANAGPTPSAGVVVLDTTGSLMTSVGMITGDLTVKINGRTVTAQYRDAAEWYPVAACPTEDSNACAWVGPTTGTVVINSRTEGE